jgi:hypothetical protein
MSDTNFAKRRKEMGIANEIPVTIKVMEHDKKTMILRVGLGEGQVTEGDEFDVAFSAGDGDPCWYFRKEGVYYTISLKELTDRVIEAREGAELRRLTKLKQGMCGNKHEYVHGKYEDYCEECGHTHDSDCHRYILKKGE